MTDKELIKQEIERLKYNTPNAYDLSRFMLLSEIEEFIDSLPEEPKKQPKFKVGDTIKGPCNNIFQVKEVLDTQYLLHSENGDELNSIEIVDKYGCISEESASEDLDYLVISLEETIGTSPHSREVIKEHLQKAAEWQKQQYEELFSKDSWTYIEENYPDITEEEKLKLYDISIKSRLAGANAVKQQMMKDAVEGEVVYQIGSAEIAPTDIQYKVMSDRVYIPNVKLGDKVKIIIVKEECYGR